MSKKADAMISVVAPIRDGEGSIGGFVRELWSTLRDHFDSFEIVVIDNASRDRTPSEVAAVQAELGNVQTYTVAQPVPHDAAFMAGIEHALGDFVVTVDPCFDPIDAIPEMYALATSRQVDLILGVRRDRLPGSAKTVFDRVALLFYGALGRLTRVQLPASVSTLQLFSRRAVNSFADHRDRYQLFKVVGALTGLPFAEYPYERVSRCPAKRDRSTYRSAVGTALTSVILSSARPLRLLTLLSVTGAGLNLLYSVYIVVVNLVKDEVAEGWTSLSLQITGLFFILFVVLAVLCEYVLRMFAAQQHQLPYIVTGESTSFHGLRRNELNVLLGAEPTAVAGDDGGAHTAGGPTEPSTSPGR